MTPILLSNNPPIMGSLPEYVSVDVISHTDILLIEFESSIEN
jgi:hypothetical protein